MDFDFILQTILAVFLTFIILGVLLIFFVYKIHISYTREIKELREDAQRLREESQAHLQEARIHLEKAESLLKKASKLSEDSISTLDEAKNIQQGHE
ncbi:hypothetical protein [Helicobacter trogontum]|uniref:Uncharacterized protein n=1 Tax=Helicobacter trogontum TaxID=50960 RepID=A0A4U8T9P3_9HELI|nr:hypothetical protein [Helicobacter trogontum]TLD95437.1 hypothetical protein LS80_009340 [Helicobacter trogontum]